MLQSRAGRVRSPRRPGRVRMSRKIEACGNPELLAAIKDEMVDACCTGRPTRLGAQVSD